MVIRTNNSSSSSNHRRVVSICCLMGLLISLDSAYSLVATSSQHLRIVDGWASAKEALRDPNCCVVSITGFEDHLQVLQDEWADGGGPADIDLRARVRVPSIGDTTSSRIAAMTSITHDDCHDIRQSVSPLTKSEQHNNNEESTTTDPCTAALEELARGVASLATADCPEERCDGVFLRIVCASNYKARDPMFHTDKAPLRGYVTLRGVGTEFMKRPCSPLEYVALRSVGVLSNDSNDLRQARELEFIVMKGDYYESPATTTTASWLKGAGQLWQRTSACVHRSPPATTTGGRRVIISLDLADGDDDREWYEADKKREWRSGMTQRKSRLVA